MREIPFYECILVSTTTYLLSPWRSMKSMGKRFSMIGRLTAICEPFINGPDDFIVILRVATIRDDSQFCHIIVKVLERGVQETVWECCYGLVLYLVVQCPALLHLPRTLKLFEVYIFTDMKAVTMNKVCKHCRLGVRIFFSSSKCSPSHLYALPAQGNVMQKVKISDTKSAARATETNN